MEEVSEACSLEDDMVGGDLGDGMGVKAAPSSSRKKSQSLAGASEAVQPGAEWLSSHTGEAAWIPGLKSERRVCWKLSLSGKNVTDLIKSCERTTVCNTAVQCSLKKNQHINSSINRQTLQVSSSFTMT